MSESFKPGIRSEKIPPYSDLVTRRVVYTEMELPELEAKEAKRRRAAKEREEVERKKNEPNPDAIFTEYSSEWNAQQAARERKEREEQEVRSNARDVLPVAELFQIDDLGGKTPYEILGVPEGDMIAAHKAYRRLMRSLHPDVVRSGIDELAEKVLGGRGKESELLFRHLMKKWDNGPETLSEEVLTKLTGEKREEYRRKHREWDEARKSTHTFFPRDELLARAKEKATIVNLAWERIKKGLSHESILGVSSLWETYESEYGLVFLFPHQVIHLKGEAELRRELNFEVTDTGKVLLQKAKPTYLYYAKGYDKHIGIHEEYREGIPVKHLFAFLETQDGRRVNPALLSDLAEEYELTDFQLGTFQDMLSMRAKPNAIAEALGVSSSFESLDVGKGIDLKEVIEAMIRHDPLGSEDENHFSERGYTVDDLTMLRVFVKESIKRGETHARSRENQIVYSVAQQTGKTFAEVRVEAQNQREFHIGEVIGYVLRDFDEMRLTRERFVQDIAEIQNGPTYGLYEEGRDRFKVGVEFGRDGLRLVLPKQEQLNTYDFAATTEVFFNRDDLDILREIAYGRSLGKQQEKKMIE